MPGRHRRHRPAPVERDDGQQVEEVEEEARCRPSARKKSVFGGLADRQTDAGADGAEDRTGEPDPRLRQRVVAERLAR